MRIATLLSLLFFVNSLCAQSTLNFESVNQGLVKDALEGRIDRYELYSADISPFFDQLKSGENIQNVVLRFSSNDRWKMEINQRNLLDENYLSQTSLESEEGLTSNNILTYGGIYQDDLKGSIALTVTSSTIYGFVEKNGEELYIEPLHYLVEGVDENIFIVYDSHDVVDQGGTCGSNHTNSKTDEFRSQALQGQGEARMNCYFLEIAIASDFSMFQKYGSVGGVEGHNLGVLNNVQTNYDNEFNEEILFDVVTQFTVDCAGCDPWSVSTNAGTLLSSFRTWGNNGNFGVNFDVGELWTDRDFNGSVIGVAYVPGICNSNKYHLLQDYTSSAWGLRVLTAHELGHNFNSGHDGSGSGFIMAPSVNNTNTWSPNSLSVINNYINGLVNNGCLDPCITVIPPIADFSSDIQDGCEPAVVNFFDTSENNPTSWNWSFPGGTPSSSTQQNPQVVYANAGTYDVSLTVTNSAGADSKTEFNYVTVYPQPEALFVSNVSGRTVIFTNVSIGDDFYWDFGDGNDSNQENPIHTYIDDGVYNVVLTVSNFCGSETFTETITIITPPLPDFSAASTGGCAPFTVVFNDESTSNTTDWLWDFPGGNPSSSISQFPVVTYNSPGVYDVSLEVSNASGSNVLVKTDYITVLDDPFSNFSYTINGFTVDFTNTSLFDNSVLWDFGDSNTSTTENPTHTYSNGGSYTVSLTAFNDCDTVTSQQVIDLTITPVADLSSNVTDGCVPLSVQYSDQSLNSPTSWLWTFPGGNPASSTDQNPTVDYNATGTYDVELIATNLAGSDTLNLTNYISVTTIPVSSFTSSVNMTSASFTNTSTNADTYHWDFGDSNTSTDSNPTHDYGMDGTYTVTLTATNSCGDHISSETVVVANPPTAGATADVTSGCANLVVQFTDQSSANTSSWSWSFPGGNPSSSTDQNPTVTYENAGTFDFTLTASNSTGTDQITIEDFIVVDDVPDASFNVSVNNRDADFTNTTSNGDTYSWDFGDGNSSNLENPSHTYSSDGNYTVTLTASNNCGNDTFTQVVNISTAPTAGATADVTSGCADLFVQFTDQSSTNTTSWSWSFPGGNPSSSSDQNPTVTYENAGTFDFSLTVSNSSGSDQITMEDFIIVDDVPNASFNVSIDNRDVSFTNTTTNADSYSWDFGDGNSSNSENPTHTYASDGAYTVILIATNSCGTDEATQVINISNAPTAGATANVSEGCAPLVVQFSDLSSSNTTDWIWTFPGGDPATSNLENPVVTYNNAGSFDVQLEASNAAGSNLIVLEDFIIVNEGPTADFNSSSNELQVNFSNSSNNANDYSWDFGDGNSSSSTNPTHDYANDGTYTVRLSATNDCGTNIFEEVITVVSQPTSNFSANSNNGCVPFEIQFSDLSSSNATDWEWSFPGGNPSNSFEQNPTVVYESAGVYDVSLTVSNSAGSDTYTQQNYISVGAGPNSDFNYTENGMSVDFDNQSSNCNSYLWDFGDGNTSVEVNPTHEYLAENIYTVTLTVTNDCGTDTFTDVVNLTSTPLAGFTSSVESGCAVLQVQFNNNSTGTIDSWNWSFPGGTPETSSEQNPLVTYSDPGVYDVTLEVSSAAGSDVQTQEQLIEVFPSPTASFMSDFVELDYTFSNNSQNGSTYMWDFGDGNTSNLENPMHTYAMDGEYDVTLTVTNNCGTDVFMTTVSAVSAPVGAFSASDSEGCIPLEITMIDQSSSNVESWNWTFPGGEPSISQEQNPTVKYNAPGIYSITLEVVNSAGTFTVTRLDYIEVNEAPTAAFSTNTIDNEVSFTNSSTSADSYLWDFGDGNTSMEESPVHVYANGGLYTVTLTVTNSCGTVTETTTVEIKSVTLPSAGFSADNMSGCLPLTVNFTDNSSDNTETWLWTFEGGTPNVSTEQNPTVVYNTAGTFTVELMVGNSAGSDMLNIQDFIVVNDKPTADFGYNAQGLDVAFSSSDFNANSYDWDFGDGNSGAGESPSHSYSANGTYDVTLTVVNDCGTFTQTQTVVVNEGQSAPMAGFSADTQTGCLPTVINFVDNSTNEPTEWYWEFTGGTPATSTDQNPTVEYTTTGSFAVSLVATNSAGEDQSFEADYITIGDVPTAAFGYEDMMGGFLEFKDASNGATSWNWDFGDSSAPSQEQNPTHQYTASGEYDVILTVENFCGTAEFSLTINVVITSLTELEQNLELDLFPNPTSNEFSIFINGNTTYDLSLDLYNSLGQQVLFDHFKHSGETMRSYRVDELSSGTYFLRLYGEKGSLFKKLVVTK